MVSEKSLANLRPGKYPHTKKHPNGYLVPKLKRLLNGKFPIKDKKTKDLITSLNLPEDLSTALMLRLLLNGTEGETAAIKEILDRVDGKIGQPEQTNTKETRIIIIRDGNQAETVSRQVHFQQEQIPGSMVELGYGKDSRPNIAGNALQRADTE